MYKNSNRKVIQPNKELTTIVKEYEDKGFILTFYDLGDMIEFRAISKDLRYLINGAVSNKGNFLDILKSNIDELYRHYLKNKNDYLIKP